MSANDSKSIKVVKECLYPNRLCKFTPNAVAAELPTLLVSTYTYLENGDVVYLISEFCGIEYWRQLYTIIKSCTFFYNQTDNARPTLLP